MSLCCAVLCCAVLCYAVLCCAVLCCTLLFVRTSDPHLILFGVWWCVVWCAVILSNTESAEGVSPSDLAKRNEAYKQKKLKLKNPNFFISKTRLSVRNLPLECMSGHRLPPPTPALCCHLLFECLSVTWCDLDVM